MLLLPVVAIGLVASGLVWQLLNAQRAVENIQLADGNIATATLLTALVLDEDTGLRAYQTTENEIFLQPYEFARGPLLANTDKLKEGLRNQQAGHEAATRAATDLRTLETFRAVHARWLRTTAEPVIATIEAGGDTRDPGLNLRAKAQMDAMRKLLGSIVQDQESHRVDAVQRWEAELQHTLIALIVSALVVGLLIGIFARERLHRVSDAFQGTMAALRRHAQATYDSEQRLRAILISLGEAAVVCDLEGGIELMNQAAEQLSGWTQAEALTRPFDVIFPLRAGEARTMPESPVAEVRRKMRILVSAEPLFLTRRDGTELVLDHSGAPVHDRNGKLAGVVLVLRDVTQQRRTQAALLASEKLATAGRLAATIAHEIHNPLDSVANLLYLIKTGDSQEENEAFLDTARAELDRATQISRSLLGMYRESRTAVALDVSALLENVLLLMQRYFLKKGVRVKTDLLSPAIVTGYPVELRQVFTNLLCNAADASSPDSQITVAVTAAFAASPEDNIGMKRPGVRITIEDQGAGVAEEVRERLFQPFFSTKGEAGTGLGLWVSKGIVQKHDGSIELESRAEPHAHGTAIHVFLPRGEAMLADSHSLTDTPTILLPDEVRMSSQASM